MLSLLYLAIFSPTPAAHADISYYNFETKTTWIYFNEAQDIYKTPCPAEKIIESRNDCDQTHRESVFRAENATSYFTQGLSSLYKTPVEVTPITQPEMAALLTGPLPDKAALVVHQTELKQTAKNLQDILQHFGPDVTNQKDLDQAQAEIKSIDQKITLAANFVAAQKDLELQVTEFMRLINDPKKFTEIVDSKNQGKIWGAFAQIMAQNSENDFTFVPIHAANVTFEMGSPANELGRSADETQHLVTLTHDFEMQTTDVTQKTWVEVMGDNPSDENTQYDCPAQFIYDKVGMCPKNPVQNVNFDQAVIFINHLNQTKPGCTYRLPTEAEWEFAARAGSTTVYYFGDDAKQLPDYAWYENNAYQSGSNVSVHEVRQKRDNAFGLFDMIGNVCQWVSDYYAPFTADAVTDPTGPALEAHRVLRGSDSIENEFESRIAHRSNADPKFASNRSGLRLVRTCP